MRVAHLMQTEVRTAELDWTLSEVVQSLADGHVTALPVIDRERHLLGVVSNADVLQAQAEGPPEGNAWRKIRVEEVMSRPALTVPPDVEVHAAARQMLYADVHRLFVEQDGKLAGVLSQTDLIRALALEAT
jgi:CBS domain-containing protein